MSQAPLVFDTIERAHGRWREILPRLGIETKFLTNKHGPCPLCGGKDRYRFDDRNGNGEYYCHQCGAGVGILLVRKKNDWDFKTACDAIDEIIGNGKAKKNGAAPDKAASAEPVRSATAIAIFNEAGELRGSPAWIYLERRHVAHGLPHTIEHALRWHPACPWERRNVHGCMVGLYTDARTGEPKAIHRTAITANGEKLGRKALGPKAGCVIRLWPVATHRLVIGEGIESVLAGAGGFCYFAEDKTARRMQIEVTSSNVQPGEVLRPCWAAGDAANLAVFPVLPEIPKLFILVDNDESQAGQRAALDCARRWHGAGRKVVRLLPPQSGTDFASLTERAEP